MVRIFEILFLRHQLLANIRGILLGYRGFLPALARPAMFLQKSKCRRNMNSIYLRRNSSVPSHTRPSDDVRSFCICQRGIYWFNTPPFCFTCSIVRLFHFTSWTSVEHTIWHLWNLWVGLCDVITSDSLITWSTSNTLQWLHFPTRYFKQYATGTICSQIKVGHCKSWNVTQAQRDCSWEAIDHTGKVIGRIGKTPFPDP